MLLSTFLQFTQKQRKYNIILIYIMFYKYFNFWYSRIYQQPFEKCYFSCEKEMALYTVYSALLL